MTKVEFTIPGKAKAKGRPRMTRRGRVFTPQDTIDYENYIRVCYQQERGEVFLEGPLCAQVIVYHKIPKAMPKYKQVKALDGTMLPTMKPDLDNVAKVVLDSLNNVAYSDDSQIVILHVERHYALKPKVVVMLEELE